MPPLPGHRPDLTRTPTDHTVTVGPLEGDLR